MQELNAMRKKVFLLTAIAIGLIVIGFLLFMGMPFIGMPLFIIGIVASRITERYGKPCILVSFDEVGDNKIDSINYRKK